MPCAGPPRLLHKTASRSSSTAAGGPRNIRNNSCVKRFQNTAQRRKRPGGSRRPAPPLMSRGRRLTLVPSLPRRGCPGAAPDMGCARSTATNPGTTNGVPTPPSTVARPCMPIPHMIRGCSERHARRRTREHAGGRMERKRGLPATFARRCLRKPVAIAVNFAIEIRHPESQIFTGCPAGHTNVRFRNSKLIQRGVRVRASTPEQVQRNWTPRSA